LKFRNDYEELNNEYRIHDFVNYILIDSLVNKYGKEYINKNLKNILKEKRVRRFLSPSLLKYAKFKQDSRYNFISKLDLLGNLHNIYYDHLSNRYKKAKFKTAKKLFNLSFYVEDARNSILSINEQYDLIFLDAFTFSKAPELWTVEFMAELYRKLLPTGVLMTYSNSALVRNTFLENNFYVGKILDEKTGKFIGTIAAKDKSMIEHPLSNYEIGLCNTRAGIPYHDPTSTADKSEILKRREQEFKNSDLMTSSQYMRSRMSRNGDSNE
jgi:tRNA U34 5-methylaminomethyl-2-thiouridine-forming methyltransferase MnmC